MASQTICFFVTGDACRKLTTSFLRVIKLPSSSVHFSEGYSAALMARKAFLALMTTVTQVLISYSVNTM